MLRIFAGICDGVECLCISIAFAVQLLSALTALCALCYSFSHWRPRPFSGFLSDVLCSACNESDSESSRGQCCAESIGSLGSASILLGSRRPRVIYSHADLLKWL